MFCFFKFDAMYDIIIIGAGAAGLSAARKLYKRSNAILVIEARDRIGGRIHTVEQRPFSVPVERGAEFIHGDLPLTKSILEEASIPYQKGDGKVWQVEEGKLEQGNFFIDGWDEMLEKLKQLEQDISIAAFLRKYFGASQYDELRESVTRFVAGYDAANPEKASSFSLREEWLAEEDITGSHPEGGYSKLINFLYEDCVNHEVVFKINNEVRRIVWESGQVQVDVKDGQTFQGKKVIITIPPAVLRTDHITFVPEIPDYMEAISKIETGGVIKFLVEFKEPYWERAHTSFRKMKDLHFLFSDAAIPTWWTQKPNDVPLLTGWLAGPVIEEIDRTEEALLMRCHQSLMYLFNCSSEELMRGIRATKIVDWSNDEFARGAYAYRSVEGNAAVKILSKPIAETIYFAGEAYHDGPNMGTVEAALKSGADVAEKYF
jgi:monoamine oxidase